jgi:16S rRNA processing protein RimM
MVESKRGGDEAQGRYLAVGRIVGLHGIRGEVKVELLTDFPERFKAGAKLYLGSESEARPIQVEGARPHQGMMLVKFAGVTDRDAAEELRQALLLIPEDEAMPLADDENYAHDLIGLQVETQEGRVLGRLTEILYTSANDVYVVRGPAGELLIPALRQVVLTVDLAAGRMVVTLPEGLEGGAEATADE